MLPKKWDCNKESGELLKINEEKVPCMDVLLMLSFGPHLFLAIMFRSIVFAAFRAHFATLFAIFFKQQMGLKFF